MARHKRFYHTTLETSQQQIRLARLSTSLDRGGLIQCAIYHFNIQQCPPYVALSYCWGPANPTTSILISDRLMRIRINLYQLLRILRQHSPQPQLEYFWIDQICIDQDNTDERNHQVQQMRQIFQRASCVFAWLGPASVDSHRAMKFLVEKVGERQRYENEDFRRISPPDGEAQPLTKLFSRPYWKRLWIVQEIVLAREIIVLCGTDYTQWRNVETFFLKFEGTGDAGILISSRLEYPGEAHYALWAAISAFSRHLCHDPRDKIYGLMGIVLPTEQIVIDYTKSSEDLFLHTVNFLLSTQKVIFKNGNSAFKQDLPLLGQYMGLLQSKLQRYRLAELIKTTGRDTISLEAWRTVLEYS